MGDYISKEQFYKLAHISKATALRLIRSQLIPAIDTGKQTNRYLIHRDDVDFYLKDRIVNPDKYACPNAHLAQTYPTDFKKRAAHRLRRQIEYLWIREPDLLTVKEVSSLLGYRPETIQHWIKRGLLFRFQIGTKFYIPKSKLLDFMETDTFHSLPKKTVQHLELIQRAQYANM